MAEMRKVDCPAEQELREFVAGRLSAKRTDQLALHLDHCAGCQQLLESLDNEADRPLTGWPGSAGVPFADESQCERALEGIVLEGAHDEAGDAEGAPGSRTLGEYELLQPLGEGGMGTVYKARHMSLHTISAVKILRGSHADDASRIERFAREMIALGKLDHPNIVRALDAGDDRNIHYLVMEYVDGVDLGKVVHRQGTLPVAEACEMVRQAALGLAYVHQHGRVHRDVKPSNLMLDTTGTVKLLDLGLAHVQEYTIDEPDGGSMDDILGSSPAELTRTHQVMGTLEYMAPEQATDSRTVDKRADIYSLGCTLYKLLTGHSPLATSGSITAVSELLAHVRRPAPPVRRFRNDVPEALGDLLARMLAKNPQERPDSAEEVARQLEPFARGSDLANLVVRTRETGEQGSTQRIDRTVATDRRGSSASSGGPAPVPMAAIVLGLILMVALGAILGALFLVALWWSVPDQGLVLLQPDSRAGAMLADALAGGKIHLVDAESGERHVADDAQLPLAPGTYRVDTDPSSGLVFSQSQFTLRRGERRILTVTARASESAVASNEVPPVPVDETADEKEQPALTLPPVDLIELLDPQRDIQGTTWRLVDGALVSDASQPSALQFPYRPPNKYRWEATVERLRNNESLQIGLVAGEVPLMLIVDGYPYLGAYTGLYRLDNQQVTQHDFSHRGTLLPLGRPVRLRATVQHAQGRVTVRLEADGRQVFSWRGPTRRLGVDDAFRSHQRDALFLGNWTASLKVSDVQVFPLEEAGETIRFTDREQDAERAAAERVAWKGGEVTFLLDEEEAREQAILLHSSEPAGLIQGADAEPMESLGEFEGHDGPIKSVTVSSDGGFAVSGSGWPRGDRTVRVWDARDGKLLHVLEGHQANVMAVAVSPDDSWILSGDQSGQARLWNAGNGELVRELQIADTAGGVEQLAFTRDGSKAIGAMGHSDRVHIWDLATGSIIRSIEVPDTAYGVAVSRGGQWFAVAAGDGSVRLFSATEKDLGSEIATLAGPRFESNRAAYCVAISPDDQTLLAGYKNHVVRAWRRKGPDEPFVAWRDMVTPVAGHESVGFLPDGRHAVAAGPAFGVALLDLLAASVVGAAKSRGDGWSLAVLPDRPAVLTAHGAVHEAGDWRTDEKHRLTLWAVDSAQRSEVDEPPGSEHTGPPRVVARITARQLEEIPQRGSLHSVNLRGSQWWSDHDMAWLAGLDRLHSLQLHGTPVSAEGLGSLRPMPHLKNLSVARTGVVTDLDSDFWSGFPALQHLNLEGTGVGDETLAHVGRLESLETLRLGATRVTDAGLAQFASLPQLRWLALGRTAVTQDGLAALGELPRLSRLELSGTRVRHLDVLTMSRFPELENVLLLDVPAEDDVIDQAAKRLEAVEITTGRGPTDLARFVEPARDSIHGEWQRDGNGLEIVRGKPARLSIPVRLPQQFDLVVRVSRYASDSAATFGLPLPDGTRVLVAFNQWNGDLKKRFVALYGIDGQTGSQSPAMVPMEVFEPQNDEPVELAIRVRREEQNIAVRAERNGREILAWQGDASRSNPENWWFGPDGTQPMISQFGTEILFEELRVVPVEGRVTLPDGRPTHGDPDREVAELVLAAGGSVQVMLGQPGISSSHVQSPDELPRQAFWIQRISVQGGELPQPWFREVGQLRHLENLVIKQTTFENAHLDALADVRALTHVDAWRSSLNDDGVARLAELPELSSLRCGETNVTDAGLEHLAGHKTLRTLAVEQCAISDRALEVAASIPHLQQLFLNNTDVTGAGLAKLKGKATVELLVLAACARLQPDDLKHLSELPALRVLNVESTGMGPAACAAIQDISTLAELVMSHNPLGDEGLPPLANLPGLLELTLDGCQLTDEGLTALAAFPRLQKLELNGNRGITDKAIPRLAVLRGLTELHVAGTGITPLGIEQLRHQLPRCQVFHSQQATRPPKPVVDVKGQGVSDDTLPELLGGKNPWKLALHGPGITDASMPLVASLPSLKFLELRETSVTNEGLAALAASSTLKRVEFWNMPQITEDAVPHLTAIANIEWLALKGTAVYGPGLKPLQGRLRGLAMSHQQLDTEAFQKYIVPFGTLTGLDLAGCRVNDEAVKLMRERMDISGYLHLGFNPNIKGPGLAHIRDMPGIDRLLLTRSGIDDEGLAHLRGASHIRVLHLRETAVTDASVETLTTLTGLAELDVTGTGITEEGLQRLHAALPDTKIQPDGD